MNKIAENEYYLLQVDITKNRAFLKVRGFWKNPEIYSQFVPDWKKALKFLRHGFTVCADLSEAMVSPREAQQVHEEAQKVVGSAGMRMAAEILSKDQIMQMQSELMSKNSKIPINKFSSLEKAEAWLDSLK